MIIFGSQLFGKVDQVSELNIHVATQFFHVWYVPLIPFKTWAVVGEGGDGWQGTPISLSLKSVLTGWVRGAAVVGMLIAGAVAISSFIDGDNMTGLRRGFLALAFLIVLIGSYRLSFINFANEQRSLQILSQMGVEFEDDEAEGENQQLIQT